MNGTRIATAAGLVQHAGAETTTIDIAGHPVPVLAGGLYDRYRSNPPLTVIEREAPDVDLSWFRTLPKTRVDVGFETWSPNFYYRNSSIGAIFTADIDRLRALIPAALRAQVTPLQVWPGRGAVALTAYAYHYCDNDSYNEFSLAIVTNKPGAMRFGPFSLLGQARARDYWGYVLKLPVNTELARVRGVVGYNLPKWLTDIRMRDDGATVAFEIGAAGQPVPDVVLAGRKLGGLSHQPEFVTNSFTNVDADGRPTYGRAVSRRLGHASSTSADGVRLTLGSGALADYIRALDLGRLLKYEYVPAFQSALYAPRPLAALKAD